MEQCMDSPKYECHIMKENTYKELLKDFGLDGQLKASFLAGMVSLQGSGAYLKDLKTSSRSVKATLSFEVGTKYESINVSHELFERFVSPNVLRDDLHAQATHFVMGIRWGVHAYASVESESGLDSDAKCIKGKLSAGVEELAALLLAGVGAGLRAKAGAGKSFTSIEGEENFKFSVYADLLPHTLADLLSLPTNFKQVLTLMSKIPQLIHESNHGKGRPLEFTLYPLSEIRKLCTSHNQLLDMAIAGRNQPTQSCTFTPLGMPTIETLENLFDELQFIKQNLNDLHKDMVSNQDDSAAFYSQKIEEILTFKNRMELAEAHLRADIHQHIIAIRSHKGQVADLIETMCKFSEHSPSSPSKAKMFIKQHMEKLNCITDWKKQGVQYIMQASSSESASNNFLESCCMPPHNGTCAWEVILTFCEASNKQNELEWQRNWKTFWHLHGQSRCGEDKEAGDVDSESATRFYVQENHDLIRKFKMKVSVRRNGDVVSEDTSQMMWGGGSQLQDTPQQNLVYSKLKHEVNVQAPNARIPLQTYCPGHHVQSDCMPSCPKDILQDWACERCKKQMENGRDGFLYCLCGRVPVRTCRFRCCSQNHGPLFIAFPAQYIGIILEQQEVPQQINILLLGETGVGKSTFVNAFANYISFDSLERAASAEDLVGLIHMAFTHTDQRTFESHDIRFGPSDPNEIHHEGQSATQSCRSYTIHLNQNQIVQFIDTPGVGDTRGADQDHTNFQHMLDYLNNYTEIHGICVMLRPNTTRLTITFRFCIKELLRHLHKSASENIVFLFTNARSTFYTPGDTVTPLKKLLQEIKESPSKVDFAFNRRTVYCMDNEAFRFLLASKEGCSFSPEDTESYSKSWSKSAEECKKMLEHFRSLKPHNVTETVSLNNASSLVSKLQQPLADVSVTIQKNIAKWDEYKKDVEDLEGSKDVELEKKLRDDEVLSLQAVHLKKGARTVCYSCCEMQETDNGEIVSSNKVCHDRCRRSSRVTRALMKGKAVWFCRSMNLYGLCKVCGCEYKKHVRITYDTKVVPKKVVNKDIEKMLQNNCKQEAKELKIVEIEQRCKEWKEEQDEIIQACARFALFFKNNAITPYNDDMKAYVDHHIAAEKKSTNCNTELIAKWEAFLESYQKQMDDLDHMCTISIHGSSSTSTSTSTSTDVADSDNTYADILKLAKSLFKLKHNGKTIKNLVDEVNNCQHRTLFHNKTYHCKNFFANKIMSCATGSSNYC